MWNMKEVTERNSISRRDQVEKLAAYKQSKQKKLHPGKTEQELGKGMVDSSPGMTCCWPGATRKMEPYQL